MHGLDKFIKIRTLDSSDDPIRKIKREAASWESMFKTQTGWVPVGLQL